MNTRPAAIALAAALLLAASPARAEAPSARPAGALIDFRVELQKSVPNDLGRATLYAEMTGADPAELARKVNAAIAAGLAIAKAQAGIAVRTGNSQAWPVYGRNSRSIENWRMRSELLLESRDAAALSTVLGKLQAQLAVAHVGFVPAPDTRRTAEDEAALEAIGAFQAKAARYAAALKKPYKIRSMNISGGSHTPPPVYRMTVTAADSMPMPTEAGESNVTVSVNGQIELAE
jgi:predicted secreted protein